jgi:acyl-CoA synthetase (AMP-forming)/AMP-acid ligase II
MGVAVKSETVVELLRDACDRCPDKEAFAFEDGLAVSRQELRDLTERFAATLAQRVEPGERVALIMDNCAEFMVAFLAALACRAAVVPVNPEAGAADATHVLGNSNAVVAIVDREGAELLDRCRGDLPELRSTIELSGTEPARLPMGDERLALADSAATGDDIATVTYTSGTTGLPKGSLIDHAYLMRVTDVAVRVHEYGPDDRIFYPVKFFYIDALIALLRALQCDGTYIAVRRFSVSRFWDIVRDQRVTIMSVIGAMPAWLLKAPPSPRDRDHGVRFAIQTQIPRDLHEDLDERWGFPWLENYGMLESGIVARVPVALAPELRGSGSVGPPVPEVEVRIVDEDFNDVPVGEPGEVTVRQPSMFRGYHGNVGATATLMRDGWICTGDIGRLDERGWLSIVGRKKDVIRRSAENISAAEVEMALRGHDSVFDAAVVGVPDVETGEEVKAYVQLVSGATGDVARASELHEYCVAQLAKHKVPRYFEFVDDFPRTPSMRVRKELLRDREPAGVAWDREAQG